MGLGPWLTSSRVKRSKSSEACRVGAKARDLSNRGNSSTAQTLLLLFDTSWLKLDAPLNAKGGTAIENTI